jgi:hypothetical protein
VFGALFANSSAIVSTLLAICIFWYFQNGVALRNDDFKGLYFIDVFFERTLKRDLNAIIMFEGETLKTLLFPCEGLLFSSRTGVKGLM